MRHLPMTIAAAPIAAAKLSWDWLGVVPFFVFALMFLIVPTGFLMVGAFQDNDGNFTLINLVNLFQPNIVSAYWISIEVSAASALGGADRKSTRLNSSHVSISYAVFCLKKKKKRQHTRSYSNNDAIQM